MEYRLANGSAITDEDIERECAEYESGSWEGIIEEAADIKAYNEALMEDDATRYSMDDVMHMAMEAE